MNDKLKQQSMKRRSFLQRAGLGTAAILVSSASARGYQANETIQIGCIGLGGRWRRLAPNLLVIPKVAITAICDVWDEQLKLAKELVDTGAVKEHPEGRTATPVVDPRAFATKDYRAILDRKDLQAVMISTPDHWHAPMTIAACEAGKDVFVEKPLTHKLEEGPAVIAAVRKSKRIVQVGTQQRSIEHFSRARELIRSGHIGRVHKVRLVWNRNYAKLNLPDPVVDPKTVDWKAFLGNAPDQPFDAFRFRAWRWFWDFAGGLFTDLMVHWMDVACWFLDLGLPETVAAIGDHFMYAGKWETPDTVQAVFRFPEQKAQVQFEATVVNSRHDGSMEFMGTEATMYLDRGRFEVHPERRSTVPKSEVAVGTGTRGASDYREIHAQLRHLGNWIECVRARREPNANVEEAAKAAAIAHLANQALREGKVIKVPKDADRCYF
jgi:predicted dehydrogenase